MMSGSLFILAPRCSAFGKDVNASVVFTYCSIAASETSSLP